MLADMRFLISIVLLSILFVIANSTTVSLTQEWIPELGWEITCSWTFSPGDKLQSVSMYKDKQPFMNYKPAIFGPKRMHAWSFPEYEMNLECKEDTSKCVVIVEPAQPPNKNFHFGCDVSGEGPKFLTDEKELIVEAIVAPTDAKLEITRATDESNPVLNCSSSGIPAPNLVWTVANDEIKVPGHFRGSQSWNATSKLWYVWSTFTPPSDQTLPVVCTPKVTRAGRQIDGKPVSYSSANRAARIFYASILLAAVLPVVLLR